MSRGEGVKKLGSLFDTYKKTLKAPQGSVITAFCEVVEELLGYQVKKTNLSYQPHSKTLCIKGSGPLKSELLIHKTEILTHLKGRLGEPSAPKDII